MKKTLKGKKSRKVKNRFSAVSIILVLFVAFAGTLAFLKFYDSFIDQTLYEERLSQMREVTTQLFSGLEDVVESQWRKASNSCRKLLSEKPQDMDEFLKFMEKQAYLEDFDSQQIEFIAVDQDGKYYIRAGEQGLLGERNYLASDPEQVSFVSNSLTYDESKMFFLNRLSEPLTFDNAGKRVAITYFGILQSMEELNPYFRCSAYDGNNSVYVVDDEGLRLFSDSTENLIKGFNVYTSFSSMKYLHGSSFDDTKKMLDEEGLAYSNALLNGAEEVYYALYKMDNAQWTLVFLVPSFYVAINTVRLINTTIRLVLFFAITLVSVSIIAIVLLMRSQQKAALAVEKKNNEVLETINAELKEAAVKAEHATQKAEEASKAKTDFLANMSHDIRTPMNAIVGITGLMEHETGVSDKMQGYIEKVQLSSRHLLGLINDILDMSRIESKEVTLYIENVSLAEQIGQIDTIIRAQANEHNQSFRISVNEVVHEYLICDGVRLRQVILNLLSNAVKYTQNGGTILLDFTEVACNVPDHATFVISVTDNGFGIDSEFLNHIFEPFTRVENSVTNKIQGSGLGMAITKNIVDMMGGKIQVESEVGKGSCFTVTVTLQIDRKKKYVMEEKRILLISDENRLIQNIKASVELCTVKTQEAAIACLSHQTMDVVLLSGCVQNMNLGDTVTSLRKVAGNSTRIFCVDYVPDERMQERIIQNGIDGIVHRPFFLSNLETVLAKTITNSVSETENESILKGKRFLCAEDNELNAEILKEILEMYEAECVIYPNGEEIVKAFKTVKPGTYDVILMDIQMPKMNGFEATKAIRECENPLGKTIPIIAMTANAFSEDVKQCLNAGMDAHIAKPIDIAALEKVIRGFTAGGADNQE